MGKQFAHFSINPDVQRHALQAHAARSDAVASIFGWLPRQLRRFVAR